MNKTFTDKQGRTCMFSYTENEDHIHLGLMGNTMHLERSNVDEILPALIQFAALGKCYAVNEGQSYLNFTEGLEDYKSFVNQSIEAQLPKVPELED